MRYILIPPTVVVAPPAAVLAQNPSARPEEITFLRVAREQWLDDRRAHVNEQTEQSSPQMLRRWSKVIDAFEASGGPGGVIALEDDDYERLRRIVEAPVFYYAPIAQIACLPYTDAVLAATSVDPRTRTVAVEPAAP